MKKCPKCQYPNPDSRTYCYQCEADLAPPKPVPTPEPIAQTPVPQGTTPAPVRAALPSNQDGRQGQAVAAGVLVILGIAAFIYSQSYWTNRVDSEAQQAVDTGESAAPTSHAVTYAVAGTTSSASMTYQTPDGSAQEAGVSVPWSHSFTATEGQFLYISAQNQNDYGTVAVSIKVDGTEVKHSVSSGAYVIADTSDTL